jgi:hypothetical protein
MTDRRLAIDAWESLFRAQHEVFGDVSGDFDATALSQAEYDVLLTVTTTHRPATDLGYLLVKHPDRIHEFDMPTGTAYVMFPEATDDRCTAALLLDVDPQKLRARADAFELSQYVNDRPYAASSLLRASVKLLGLLWSTTT